MGGGATTRRDARRDANVPGGKRRDFPRRGRNGRRKRRNVILNESLRQSAIVGGVFATSRRVRLRSTRRRRCPRGVAARVASRTLVSISDERTLRGGAADGIVGRRSSRLGVRGVRVRAPRAPRRGDVRRDGSRDARDGASSFPRRRARRGRGGIAIATRVPSPARARRARPSPPRWATDSDRGVETPLRAALSATLETAAKVSGGSFIARRFARDAWPNSAVVLERREGVPARVRENHRRVATRTTVSRAEMERDDTEDTPPSEKTLRDRKFLRGGRPRTTPRRRGDRIGRDDSFSRRWRTSPANETSRGAALTDVARLAAEQTTERALRRGTRGRERRRRRPREGWPPSTRMPRGFGGRSPRRDGTDPPTPVAPTWKQTDGTKDGIDATVETDAESTPNRVSCGSGSELGRRLRVRSGRPLCQRCRVFGRFVPGRTASRARSDARGTRWRC